MSSPDKIDRIGIVTFAAAIVVLCFSFAITATYFYPLTLSPENARSLFEKIVDIDGVLLGFEAVVFGVTTTKIKLKVGLLLGAVVPSVALYLFSICTSFLGMAAAATSGFSFVVPISTMISATAFFFCTFAFVVVSFERSS